ncbi:MAG: cyclase family protein [Candidatus Omnitrophota bacterium]|nr:cyclase family protein [Candidatus Omnitrophota bacterium]
MKRVALFLLLAFFIAGHSSWAADEVSPKIIDLSHAFDEDTIYWPNAEGFTLENISRGMTKDGYYYYANRFRAPEHGGTHIDAPRHFSESGWTVDKIPLERLVGQGVMVDVSKACAGNRDYQIQIKDFLEWEAQHGTIPAGTIIFMNTGYGKFWPNRKAYLGTDKTGPGSIADLHFPGLHPDAARWLVDDRIIQAAGLDTPSIDYGQSKDFASHVELFKENLPILENLANLDLLPAKGFMVIALPMKIRGGSGAPTRVIAIR